MAFNRYVLASILANGASGYAAGVQQAQARRDAQDAQVLAQRNWQATHDLAAKSEADQMTDSQAGRDNQVAMQQAGFGQQRLMSDVDYGHSADLSRQGFEQNYDLNDQGYDNSIGLQNNQGNIAAAESEQGYKRDLARIGMGIALDTPKFEQEVSRIPSSPGQVNAREARQWVADATLGPGRVQVLQQNPGTMSPLDLEGQQTAANIRHIRASDDLSVKQYQQGKEQDAFTRRMEIAKYNTQKAQFGDTKALEWAKLRQDASQFNQKINSEKAGGKFDPSKWTGIANSYGSRAESLNKAANDMENKIAEWGVELSKPVKDSDGNMVAKSPAEQQPYLRNIEVYQRRVKELRAQAQQFGGVQDTLLGLITGQGPAAGQPSGQPEATGDWVSVGKTGVTYRDIGRAK